MVIMFPLCKVWSSQGSYSGVGQPWFSSDLPPGGRNTKSSRCTQSQELGMHLPAQAWLLVLKYTVGNPVYLTRSQNINSCYWERNWSSWKKYSDGSKKWWSWSYSAVDNVGVYGTIVSSLTQCFVFNGAWSPRMLFKIGKKNHNLHHVLSWQILKI